jgi:Ca-activated chloride channel family protein
MTDFNFANPQFFWLLLLIPIVAFWYIKNIKKQSATLKISSISGFKNTSTFLSRIKPYLFIFRLLSFAFLIIAMARPRSIDAQVVDGIDIVMAIDVSTSMFANDLKPNRLEALKKVASQFVLDRKNDRIGLVIYAGEAYTRVPVTSDKNLLLQSIQSLNFDGLIDDGTAIGMGLTTAVNRLRESKAKSKVIILLTDGVNNAGFIEPETAADIAHENAIKVYTIGIGTNGMANFPVGKSPITGEILFQQMPVQIDQELLKNIAHKTNGKYFRAINNEKLESIYNEINKLETSKLEDFAPNSYTEDFRPFALLALLFLILEFLCKHTIFKGIV